MPEKNKYVHSVFICVSAAGLVHELDSVAFFVSASVSLFFYLDGSSVGCFFFLFLF